MEKQLNAPPIVYVIGSMFAVLGSCDRFIINSIELDGSYTIVFQNGLSLNKTTAELYAAIYYGRILPIGVKWNVQIGPTKAAYDVEISHEATKQGAPSHC